MKAIKDLIWFVGFSLASVALLMILKSKTNINYKELISIFFLFSLIFFYNIKYYKINLLTIIYSLLVSTVLLTLIDSYPSLEFLLQYIIVLLISFFFHNLKSKRE